MPPTVLLNTWIDIYYNSNVDLEARDHALDLITQYFHTVKDAENYLYFE